MKRIFYSFIYLVLAFVVLSCSNIFNNSVNETNGEIIFNNAKYGDIEGVFSVGDAVSSSVLRAISNSSANSSVSASSSTLARTAMPSFPEFSSLELKVFAQCGNEAPIVGIVNDSSYVINKIPFGKQYKIFVQALLNDVIILEGVSSPFTLSEDNPNVELEDISLHGIQNINGKIRLPISFDAATKSAYPNLSVVYFLDSDAAKSAIEDSGNFLISVDNVRAGSHTLGIEIYSEDNGNKKFIYGIYKEAVNVCGNLTTDTWIKNGEEEYFSPSAEGKFNLLIKNENVSGFKYKGPVFYVDAEKSVSGLGYSSSPFNSIQEAIDTIYSVGVENKNYVINVVSNIDKSKISTVSDNGNCYFGKISSSDKRKITIQGSGGNGPITIDAADDQKNVGIFYFSSTTSGTEITLKNLILKNGHTTFNGGGIYNNYCKLTLEDISIQDCSVSYSSNNSVCGGGIYNSSNTLYLKNNVVISGCSVENTGSGKSCGGGIYNLDTLNIEDAVIENCSLSDNSYNCEGAGIYNFGNSTSTISKAIITGCKCDLLGPDNTGYGGAIYNCATLYLGNESSSADSPNVIIGTGTYKGTLYNKPNSADIAGGIYTKGTLVVYNDCVIGSTNKNYTGNTVSLENEESSLCASALYIDENAVNVQISGAIMHNKAVCSSDKQEHFGGTIYSKSANVKFSNLVISNNDVFYNQNDKLNGYSVCLNANAIFDNVKIYENSTDEIVDTSKRFGSVYVNQGLSLVLNGNTWISGNEDIYLANNTTITVNEELTPKNQNEVSQNRVAVISAENGQKVLSGTVVETEYTKFAAANTDYFIGSGGYLMSKTTPSVSSASSLKDIITMANTNPGTQVTATINKPLNVSETIEVTGNIKIEKSGSGEILKTTPDSPLFVLNSPDAKLELGTGLTLSYSLDSNFNQAKTLIEVNSGKLIANCRFEGHMSNGKYASIKYDDTNKHGGAITIGSEGIVEVGGGFSYVKGHYAGAIAVHAGGQLTVKSGTVFSNCVSSYPNYGDKSYGGAIYTEGTVIIEDSVKILKCSCNTDGGGIYVATGGSCTISEATFEENDAEEHGGAISVASGGKLITNGTIFEDNTIEDDGDDHWYSGVYIASGAKWINISSTINGDNQHYVSQGAYYGTSEENLELLTSSKGIKN